MSDESAGKQRERGAASDAKRPRYCYTLHSSSDELVQRNNRAHFSWMRSVITSSSRLHDQFCFCFFSFSFFPLVLLWVSSFCLFALAHTRTIYVIGLFFKRGPLGTDLAPPVQLGIISSCDGVAWAVRCQLWRSLLRGAEVDRGE